MPLTARAVLPLVNVYNPANMVAGSVLAHAWRADAPKRLSFAGPMRATGSSPPVATLSGTFTIPYSIWAEITSTGTLTAGVGTALYRWSKDGGVNWTETNVTVASTRLLAGTGRTLNLPDGTYNSGVLYKQTVASIGNAVPGKGPLGSTVASPVYVHKNVGISNRGCLYFPGDCGLALDVTPPGSGNDQPYTSMMVAQHLSAGGINATWTFQAISGSGVCEFYSEGGLWKINKRDDAGTLVTRTGGTADSNWHVFTVVHDGTSVAVYVDDTQITLSSSAMNVGNTALGRIAWGGSTVSSLFYESNIASQFIWSTALSDFARKAHVQALRRFYGI